MIMIMDQPGIQPRTWTFPISGPARPSRFGASLHGRGARLPSARESESLILSVVYSTTAAAGPGSAAPVATAATGGVRARLGEARRASGSSSESSRVNLRVRVRVAARLLGLAGGRRQELPALSRQGRAPPNGRHRTRRKI